jgi:hypothetical protein
MRFEKRWLALVLGGASLVGCAHVAPVAAGPSMAAGGVSNPSPQGSNAGPDGASSGSVSDPWIGVQSGSLL